MSETKRMFPVRLALAAALAAVCLAATAFADAPEYRNDVGLELVFERVGALNQGSRFYAGDTAVLAATVTNKTDAEIAGTLSFHDPVLKYLEPVAVPAAEKSGSGYALRVGPHASETVAFVYSFPFGPDPGMPRDWQSMALFRPDSGGEVRGSVACAYGCPCLVLDRAKIERDGVIDIRNDGDGGAGDVRFRFWPKKDVKNVPDGASILDDGRVELRLGGIAAKGSLSRDVSGFLHEYMDEGRPWELVFSDGALGLERKAAEGLFRKTGG